MQRAAATPDALRPPSATQAKRLQLNHGEKCKLWLQDWPACYVASAYWFLHFCVEFSLILEPVQTACCTHSYIPLRNSKSLTNNGGAHQGQGTSVRSRRLGRAAAQYFSACTNHTVGESAATQLFWNGCNARQSAYDASTTWSWQGRQGSWQGKQGRKRVGRCHTHRHRKSRRRHRREGKLRRCHRCHKCRSMGRSWEGRRWRLA